MLPGDFIFIYKQDKNPSSFNLGEQKMGEKRGVEGAGEHPGEEEVGRASVHHVPQGGRVSLHLESPSFQLPGGWPDSRGNSVVTLGQALEPCLAADMGSAWICPNQPPTFTITQVKQLLTLLAKVL